MALTAQPKLVGVWPESRRARLSLAAPQRVARPVAPGHAGDFILSADTVVACGRRILPKAETAEQADLDLGHHAILAP